MYYGEGLHVLATVGLAHHDILPCTLSHELLITMANKLVHSDSGTSSSAEKK